MSLVSTVPAETAAAALNPILYDSGWKSVTGINAFTDLESLQFDTDSIVHLYGKMYRNTQASYYNIRGVYASSGASPTDLFGIRWKSANTKSLSSTSSFNAMSVYEANPEPSNVVNQSSETRNSNGFILEKGTSFVFQQNSSVSTSMGIQYRVVVERSDGEQMVKWANNA